jgi:nitrile hydratase beta subunit
MLARQTMDGVHDMGGMHGFGPIERDEATFHAQWEKRVHALRAAAFTRGIGPGNVDAARHAIESIEPAVYLRSSYYERWLAALQTGLVKTGVLDEAAIEARARLYQQNTDAAAPSRSDLPGIDRERAPQRAYQPRSGGSRPHFAPGDKVVTRNIHPPGHTRLPRYARGKRGFIFRVHGIHAFPDTNAHGLGPQPQPLYSVRFEAAELWGASAEGPGSIYLDLWETYLEKEDA